METIDDELESENSGAQNTTRTSEDKKPSGNSGTARRLVIILGVFAILAGGIWGYKQYLKSTIPKGDEDSVKELAEGAEEPVEQTGLSVLSEMFSPAKPSKEIEELKGKSADEVAFTYDAIMKMTPTELEKNTKDLRAQLREIRSHLPPSFGGATMGPPPNDPSADSAGKSTKMSPMASLALPLEVMQQVAQPKR